MKFIHNAILLAAGDLSGHIACVHLTDLDLASAKGTIEAPQYRDPMLAILQERGLEFELGYLQKLKDEGLAVADDLLQEMKPPLKERCG